MQQAKLYTCESLPECAYLIAVGYDPIERKASAAGRTAWIFEHPEPLANHSLDFNKGRSTAGLVKRFMQARRRLLNEAAEREL